MFIAVANIGHVNIENKADMLIFTGNVALKLAIDPKMAIVIRTTETRKDVSFMQGTILALNVHCVRSSVYVGMFFLFILVFSVILPPGPWSRICDPEV